MARTVVLSREALRALRRMPPNTAGLIRSKLDQLAVDPATLANNVKALQGERSFRLRVGDWRIMFTFETDRIVVSDIGPRSSIYR